MTQPYLSPAEVIYRELARPKPAVVKPASVVVVKPLTRDDVTAIIARTRSATADELQDIIEHAKDFALTDGQRNQLGLDLSILSAQRARDANGRRENPSEQFVSQTLKLLSTPYGLIEREWYERLLHSNSEAIGQCRDHRPPRCACWSGAREMLWHAVHTHGNESPEAWTATQVWNILEELETASRPGYTSCQITEPRSAGSAALQNLRSKNR
jgi:hypothetical protein